jgi:hypothetical protein
MSLLSADIQIRPGVIHSIIELALFAKRPLTDDEYSALLQPAAITALTGATKLTDVLPGGLRFCEEVGLLTRNSDGLAPSSATAKLDPKTLHRELANLVGSLVLGGPARDGEPPIAAMTDDLLQSAAWLLAQDVWTTPTGVSEFESLLRRQWPTGPQVINPDKDRALREWGPYLGILAIDPFALPAQSRLLLDPTRAVHRATLGILDSRMPASEFITQLSSRICVIDGGWKRLEVTGQVDQQGLPWESEPNLLSPTLSLALHRLERRGVIKLTEAADTPPERRRIMKMAPDAGNRRIDEVKPGEAFGAGGKSR